MINEQMFALGDAPNRIREIYAYGLERKAQIGDDNVFDLSIGNPSVPSPVQIDEAIAKFAQSNTPMKHGYTPSLGLEWVRQAVAENINKRFGQSYDAGNVYLTAGASGAIASTVKGLSVQGEEVIVNVPFYPEYRTLIETAGATLVGVSTTDDFQLDAEAIEAAINPKTAAVIINSPNNPVGTVYTRENIEAVARVLESKSQELSRPIYLISDEPYRELIYDGAEMIWVPDIYAATVVCYSWSKSFSLPGERIGYALVPDAMPEFDRVFKAVSGAGRGLGYICDSVLFQNVIGTCIDAPVDCGPYLEHRKILTEGLSDVGFTYIQPRGGFFLWLRGLEENSKAFCERAKKFELLLVPSDGFGVQGWARAGYCASKESVAGSIGAFRKLFDDYGGYQW